MPLKVPGVPIGTCFEATKDGCTLEASLGIRVPLYDASYSVMRKRKYRTRKSIKRIYVHHSGRAGAPGLAGAQNTARYVVKRRGFPGPAYHYWLPYDEAVVYRLNHDVRRCWHTGGRANTHGLGVCLQGNTTKRPMSDAQRESLPALLAWLEEKHHLWQPHVSWHAASGPYGGKAKGACPGAGATAWLRAWCQG